MRLEATANEAEIHTKIESVFPASLVGDNAYTY